MVDKTVMIQTPSGKDYMVKTSYCIRYNHGALGCSFVIHELNPVVFNDGTISDNELEEVESALAFKLVNDFEDDNPDIF